MRQGPLSAAIHSEIGRSQPLRKTKAVAFKKIIFVGSRCSAYDKLYQVGIRPRWFYAKQGSLLEAALRADGCDFALLPDKKEFLIVLRTLDWDLLISNGCPHILPASDFQKEGRVLVNIHPSLVPDLRGKSPINGAMLFGREAGASCHLMDDDIDTGPVIANVRVDVTASTDLGTLYKLCFMAEGEAFVRAAALGFAPPPAQTQSPADTIYFSRTDDDMHVDWASPLAEIVRKVRAFGLKTQGAWSEVAGRRVRFLHAEIVDNAYLASHAADFPDRTVVFRYDDTMVVKLHGHFLRLACFPEEGAHVLENDRL